METIYKEESHVHQYIIPFETAVWNEEDLPPRRPQQITAPTAGTNPGSQQNNALTVSTDQQTQQNNDSGSGQNNITEQQDLAALPQRDTQNRGGNPKLK